MEIGVNLPWGDYGKDFGGGGFGLTVDPNKNWRTFINEISLLKQSYGINIIRMFILADGPFCNPQPTLSSPSKSYLAGMPGPESLSSQFKKDFTDLLEMVRGAHMMLLPVFVDHRFCYEGGVDPHTGLVKGGRADLINDDNKRRAFLHWVLWPLVDISTSFRSTIFAWDLINEPELCTVGCNKDAGGESNVKLEKMQAFIQEGCSTIRSAQLDATVGFQYFETLTSSQWSVSRLGVTRYQFHYYGASNFDGKKTVHRPIPSLSVWPRSTRCFIGEIGTRDNPDARWPELRPRTWRGGCQRNEEAQRLDHKLAKVEELGYPLVLLWSRTAHLDNPFKPKKDQDQNSEWENRTLAAITTYLNKRPRKL